MKKDKDIERDLRNPNYWNLEQVETREPVKSPRVVVSVAFQHDDFKNISQAAKQSGKRTSEFIREAALEKATGRFCSNFIHSSGNTGIIWFTEHLQPTTRSYGLGLEPVNVK